MTLSRESRKYLWDALRSADRVLGLTASRSFDDYAANDMLRWAVERQLAIVGEALAQLLRRDPGTARLVSDLAQIVAFRNILAHGYEILDDTRVWAVIQDELPDLRLTLARLLGEEEVR